MKTSRKTILSMLSVFLTAAMLVSCAPAGNRTVERLSAVVEKAHLMIDKLDYPQGDAYKKQLHSAVDLAAAATDWQLAVYSSPESGVQAAAAQVRKVVEEGFPAVADAAVLDEMGDAAKWKADPSTATVPPAMLAHEMENQDLDEQSILFEMTFMRLGAVAGCETIRSGLGKGQENIVNLGEVILENNLNRARDRLTQIPPGYPEKLDGFFVSLKEGRLTDEDALNIQEEEMDTWFANLTFMLLQSWSGS